MTDATNGSSNGNGMTGSPNGRKADDIFETVRQANEERVGEAGTTVAVENPEKQSGPRGKAPFPAFDDHHPPEKDLISDCVHCGFCLPACPTYVLFGEEMDSPRGRIYLMNKGLKEEAMNDQMVGHFDNCLGCMACVTACPSGVQYDKLIEATRAQVERRHERTADDKAFREMIFQLFPYPARLRAAAAPMRFYKKFGVGEKLRKSGIMGILPKRVQAMEALLPDLPKEEKISEVTPAKGEQRYRVGILTGCVQRVFFSHVNAATVRVLTAEGCEVVAPESQGCCGALSTHAGREDESIRFAKQTIETFENLDLDHVIINSAGCGSTMKEYGHILRDEPEYAERAERFSASVRDISEFIQEIGAVAPRNPLPVTVAYHDACHLSHAQGIKAQPRDNLKAIPGMEVKEIKEGDICCGSAGIYNMVQPESASMLGERKAKNVAATGAKMIVTSNPGCTLQIQGSLKKLGHGDMPARHPVEVIDASIRGESVESLFDK